MNKTIITTYILEALDEQDHVVFAEEATVENPFKFISGMGFALDAFEQKLLPLEEGADFDFTLQPEEAYGPYEEEHIKEFDKSVFCVDGRFDDQAIHHGAFIPLVNDDGQRFQGRVIEITANTVKIDLNDPLANYRIRFRGHVIVSRPATNKEIEAMANLLSGEECECGCGCGHEHDKKHKEGCCGHHHEHGGHECCHKHH